MLGPSLRGVSDTGPRGWPEGTLAGDEGYYRPPLGAGRLPAPFDDAFLLLDASTYDGSARWRNLGTARSQLDAVVPVGTTNEPLMLRPDPGGHFVYLPGGSNNVTCTAPATATSFAAYPSSGAAPTTGAATEAELVASGRARVRGLAGAVGAAPPSSATRWPSTRPRRASRCRRRRSRR
jgi:hypothetical protein